MQNNQLIAINCSSLVYYRQIVQLEKFWSSTVYYNTFWALVSTVPLIYFSCTWVVFMKGLNILKKCQNIFQYNLKFKRCRRDPLRKKFCNNWNLKIKKKNYKVKTEYLLTLHGADSVIRAHTIPKTRWCQDGIESGNAKMAHKMSMARWRKYGTYHYNTYNQVMPN